MIDEKKLIDRILSGDQDAFSTLMQAYEDKVYNLCLRMCADREEAKDLAQEAFIKAWRGLKFYKQEAAFSTWLYRLTSNVCIDFLRQKKRKAAVSLAAPEDEQIDIPDPAPRPDELVLQKQRNEAVAEAMSQLEDEFRLVLALRVVQERSYEEIAEIMDLKPGTVKSRLARAREKLRKVLLKNGNDFFDGNVESDGEGDAT